MTTSRPPHPAWLRPDIRADHTRLADRRLVTVYRCPHPRQGPVRIVDGDGQLAWTFMYAHFVFTWPQHHHHLTIGHGTLEQSTPLWQPRPPRTDTGVHKPSPTSPRAGHAPNPADTVCDGTGAE
ncbi:MAG: hypothetical protein M3Z25_04855 [Actinomycetota bacterium]|nr:hypothetical protein [Actinomycetota bacterium]